jgi:hypothetical protein
VRIFKNYTACIAAFFIVLQLGGCATADQSIGLGGAVGAGTGIAIGAIADPGKKGEYRTRNIMIGGTLGAMTGLIAGSAIHSSAEKLKGEAFNAGRVSAPPVDPNEEPKLIPAQWRAEVVEARRVGNRFVPRHIEYIITEQARWEEAQ